MTIAKLYENHKKGKVSKQSFLNEARKDANLPWVTNMTSYEDAIKILKNKGIISETNLNVPGAVGSSNQRVQYDSYSSNAEMQNQDLNELSPQTRYNAAIKAVDKSKNANRDSNDAEYRKAVKQGNKFLTQVDPEVKNVVDKFASSLGLEARIEKGITDSTYEPSITIKMGPSSSKPEIVVFIRKNSNKIEGGLPDEAAERRLGNIIKQIQQKELNVEVNPEAINEAHKLTTTQIIDRLNPYAFKHAMEFELSKHKEKLTDEIYEKTREKVAKKMAKNPEAYRDTQLANSKDVQKRDKKLAMVDVKDNNTVDKDNEMKKIKGFEAKKNTSTPKSENKKGKPKGVKEMKGSKKKPSGVQTMMESANRQDLVNELTSFFKKKISISENTVVPHERTDYHIGTEIKTPEGLGKVTEVNGSVVQYELEGGVTGEKTLNVIDKLNGMNQSPEDMKRAEKAKDKAERDKMWADWDKRGEKSFGGMLTDPEHFTKPLDYKNIMEKIKKVLDKLKMKKESGIELKPVGGSPKYVKPSDVANAEKELKSAGITNFTKKVVG